MDYIGSKVAPAPATMKFKEMLPSQKSALKWTYLLIIVLIASLTLTTSYRDYHGDDFNNGLITLKGEGTGEDEGVRVHAKIGITYSRLKQLEKGEKDIFNKSAINCKNFKNEVGSATERRCNNAQNLRDLSAVVAAFLYVAVAVALLAHFNVKFFSGLRGIVIPDLKWTAMRLWKKMAFGTIFLMWFVLFLNSIIVVDYGRELKDIFRKTLPEGVRSSDVEYGIQFKTAICTLAFSLVQLALAVYLYAVQATKSQSDAFSALIDQE